MQKTVCEKLTKTLNERLNESFKVLADEFPKTSKSYRKNEKAPVGVLFLYN